MLTMLAADFILVLQQKLEATSEQTLLYLETGIYKDLYEIQKMSINDLQGRMFDDNVDKISVYLDLL